MCEIVSRGKRKDNGEWVYGWYCRYPFGRWPLKDAIIPSEEAESWYFRFVEVDPSTVGRYTWLTDKNGKRIFEGDVVECGDYNAEDGYGEIIWDMETARFAIIGCSDNNLISDFDNYYGYELDVIGNIHDNPELLEEVSGNEL